MVLLPRLNPCTEASGGQHAPGRAARPVGLALARRYAPAVIGLAVLTGAAACSAGAGPSGSSVPSGGTGSISSAGNGSASAGPSASGRGSNLMKKDVITGLISFKGHLTLTGAHHSSASFTAFPGVRAPASSCARIGATGTPVGKNSPKQFTIPAPAFGGNITIAAQVESYHGPGTYQLASLGKATALITVGSDTYKLTGPGTSVSVRVAADGSGTFTFINATAEKHGAAALSGSIRWTCLA